MKSLYKSIFICSIMLIFTSTVHSNNNSVKLKEESVEYTINGVNFKGFVAYDENLPGKRAVVLVVPEWWGLNDYAKMRTRKLAELGYLAMAVDMYGNGKIALNPTEAQALATPFYADPQIGKSILDAALKKIEEFPQADRGKIAAIGYCFGGSAVLNYAKLGASLKGVVSFHGGLKGVPAKKELLKAQILVCHGGSDQFVPEQDVKTFKHQLDSIGAIYTFKVYPNSTHAFTNPDATKVGKQFNMPIEYNAAADKDSWEDMKLFLQRLFSQE